MLGKLYRTWRSIGGKQLSPPSLPPSLPPFLPPSPQGLQLHIPVDKKLVFELRERIYNFFSWKNMDPPVIPQFKLSRDPSDHLPKVSVYKNPYFNIWRVAIYNPENDFMVLNYFAFYTKSTPIHPPPANEDQLEWLVSSTLLLAPDALTDPYAIQNAFLTNFGCADIYSRVSLYGQDPPFELLQGSMFGQCSCKSI